VRKPPPSKWSKSERNKIESPFAPFPSRMIESPAFRVLSNSGLKVLLYLGAVWASNGGLKHNINGKLIATYRQICGFWPMSMGAVSTAIREVILLGFVEITVKGCAGNADERQPSQYRLTYLPAEGVPGAGSHEWRRITTIVEARRIARVARRAPAEYDGRRTNRAPSHGTETGRKKHFPALTKASRSHLQNRAKSLPRDGHGTDFPHLENRAFSISRPVEPDPRKDADDLKPSRVDPSSCAHCGAALPSRRPNACYCSTACRKRAHRRRHQPNNEESRKTMIEKIEAQLAWTDPPDEVSATGVVSAKDQAQDIRDRALETFANAAQGRA
jgi:ferredoxin